MTGNARLASFVSIAVGTAIMAAATIVYVRRPPREYVMRRRDDVRDDFAAAPLPVIEAARKVVERVLPDSPAMYGPEMSDHIRAGNDALTALRAALAEYDR